MKAVFSKYEHSYLNLLENIMENGAERNDRTGVGTKALFSKELTHDWQDGFPLLTHRVFGVTGAIAEMTCFIKGLTHIKEFENRGCYWWRDNLNDFNKRNNCPENLDLGNIYGKLWRDFHGVDQLTQMLEDAVKTPHSRRLMVTAWDPSTQHTAVLPPCHYGFQIFIDGDELDLLFNMRSVDWILGCPADMTAYGFLQLAICRHLGKRPGKLHAHFGDTHVYASHFDGARVILDTAVARELPQNYGWKTGVPVSMFELEPHHFTVEKFDRGPSMSFEMAV